MRVQDIHGRWYEVEDALLAKCEVKSDDESGSGGRSRTATNASAEIRSDTPATGSTPAQGSADSC